MGKGLLSRELQRSRHQGFIGILPSKKVPGVFSGSGTGKGEATELGMTNSIRLDQPDFSAIYEEVKESSKSSENPH